MRKVATLREIKAPWRKYLSWGYQFDLKKALEASGNNKDSPFKITYNGNDDEGMKLYAKRKK